MNYSSWKKKYPFKPFPHKLEKFGLEKSIKDVLAIQIQDAMMKAHQTAINNYGIPVFFGNTYTLSPTTISYTTKICPVENITFNYITK